MKWHRFLILTGSMTMFAAGASAQNMSAPKTVTLEMAQTMAETAMATCRASGWKVTVLVVDGLNVTKLMLRDDGAFPATEGIAHLKATSSLMFNRPSGPFAPLPPGTPMPPPILPGTINATGAYPIKSGEATIGAIAVSGAPTGDNDASCASAGLAKVADKLK